jgi:hypothetical protein
MNIKRLLDRAQKSQLFRSIGDSPENGCSVISSWEEWPGPEDPLVSEIHYGQQAIKDKIFSVEQETEWNEALALVVGVASKNLPYDPSEDSWYAPNVAVWQAAWVFCLEELYQSNSIPVPNELVAQIYWFEKGHWPCALLSLDSIANPKGYLVY